MEVDRSPLSAPKSFDGSPHHYGKENADRNTPLNIILPSSPVAMGKVLTPVTLNRSSESPSQSHRPVPMDISLDEEKLAAMISHERGNSRFGEGVRRESFPGKYVHSPDVSFNCEGASVGDKSYSSDVTHGEMSFMYNARSSTPVSAHEVPLTPTVQRARATPGVVGSTSNAPPESGLKDSQLTPTFGLEGLDVAIKPRVAHPRSPLSFEVDAGAEEKHRAPTREFDFIPPKRSNSSEKLQSKGLVPPATGLKSISARAAALRFILPEDSLMEMDSILDVQFPEGMEDEFTAAFARLALGSSGSGPQSTEVRSTAPGPTMEPQEGEPVRSDQRESVTTVERQAESGSGPTGSDPIPDEANDSYLEDEQTLNIASLGLSGVGNTLLMDTSLDQLRSKPNEVERGDTTFGGLSFAISNSNAAEYPTGATLEAYTPKRTASNPLPQIEDNGIGVETTAKKPQLTNGWVASDVAVDVLRSGRALHRATNSISSVSGTAGLTNRMDGADEQPLAKSVWPGSTASLRRTESFTTSHPNTVEPRQYPGSAVPLQRTRSTMSLRRTSSATSYQPDFMRPHSRASVVDFDSEDDQPYTPGIPVMSRGSSRRSSVYALPESGNVNDHPASYFERPSSVASIYDRPTSAASMRPTSAASIRTSSTRPTSVAGSLRSESAASSRRVSGAHIQPSAEDELVKGIEPLMRGSGSKAPITSVARNTQETPSIRRTKVAGVEGGVTKDNKGVPRSAIRPSGLSALRPTGSTPGTRSGLGPAKPLGSKIVSGVPGSKPPIGSSTRTNGLGSSAKTMSAVSGRSVPITVGSGTRSTTSTLRTQSSTQSSAVRTRASTLGLFAPDGGPGEGQELKKPTHKASSASLSATPSTTRSLRPPAIASSTRTLVPRGANTNTGPARAAATAGSIASLREAMKSKEAPKR